ncbi:MAG: hypothetical protein N2645_14495 [Clostridia bacterium]|nr:hypothetical protein [Clostridia bacterium]
MIREKQVHDEFTRIAGAKAEGKIEVARKMLSSDMDTKTISGLSYKIFSVNSVMRIYSRIPFIYQD